MVECEHHSHIRRGEIRCKKCHARHVFMPGGARWIPSKHKGGYPKGKPRHPRTHHEAHRTEA